MMGEAPRRKETRSKERARQKKERHGRKGTWGGGGGLLGRTRKKKKKPVVADGKRKSCGSTNRRETPGGEEKGKRGECRGGRGRAGMEKTGAFLVTAGKGRGLRVHEGKKAFRH